MKKTAQKKPKVTASKSEAAPITGRVLPRLVLKTTTGANAYSDRSALDGLTKLEIAECILEMNPSFGFRNIYDMLLRRKIADVCEKKDAASKKLHGRRMKQFMRFKILTERAERNQRQLLPLMCQFPKDWLVELSYTLSDRRLNHWYNSPTHSAVVNLDRDDPRIEYRRNRAYVLKEERAIQINSDFWQQQWDKRKKRGIKLRFRSHKKTPPVHKATNDSVEIVKLSKTGAKLKRKTLNWVEALKSHNRYMSHSSTVNGAEDFGR